MKKALFSDNDIMNGLKNKDHSIIRFVYRNYFEVVHRLIINNSGNTEDAEDIFQDTMVIIFNKISSNNLKLSCSLKTFIYAISKNLWLQKLQRSKNDFSALKEPKDETIETLEFNESLKEEIKFNLYQKHFLKLHKDCQKVLKLFLKKVSLAEITRIMDFSSAAYTKSRKYLCKKILKEKILNDPEFINLQAL